MRGISGVRRNGGVKRGSWSLCQGIVYFRICNFIYFSRIFHLLQSFGSVAKSISGSAEVQAMGQKLLYLSAPPFSESTRGRGGRKPGGRLESHGVRACVCVRDAVCECACVCMCEVGVRVCGGVCVCVCVRGCV